MAIANLVIVKTRPLEPGHELRLYAEPGRKKDRAAVAACSCSTRDLSSGAARQGQAVLDAAARSHRSEILYGDFRQGRMIRDLEAELEHETDVAEIVDRYGTPGTGNLDVYVRTRLADELDHRLWTEEPRRRRTPAK